MPRLNTLNKATDAPKVGVHRLLTRAPLLILLSLICVSSWLHFSGFFDKLSTYALKRIDRKMVSYGMHLSHVYVKGCSRIPTSTILKHLGLQRNESFRKLDLSQAYEALRRLPWVKALIIERRWPNQVVITVTERQPLALWQHQQKIQLVDLDGQPIPSVDITQFTTYPLIIGEGAPQAAALFLEQLSRIPSLRPYIQTMIRVGQRRWNIKLTTGLTIMLPEEGVEEALTLLNQLHTTHKITDIAQKNLDLRIPQKVIYE